MLAMINPSLLILGLLVLMLAQDFHKPPVHYYRRWEYHFDSRLIWLHPDKPGFFNPGLTLQLPGKGRTFVVSTQTLSCAGVECVDTLGAEKCVIDLRSTLWLLLAINSHQHAVGLKWETQQILDYHFRQFKRPYNIFRGRVDSHFWATARNQHGNTLPHTSAAQRNLFLKMRAAHAPQKSPC